MQVGENEVRVALFGCRGVGKSAIIFRYMDGTFREKYEPSMGEDYRLSSGEHTTFGLHIIDAIYSNTESFFITEYFLQTSSAIGFVYSITSQQSFEWIPVGMEKISRIRNSETPFIKMIIASKADLEESRKISLEDGLALAEKYNALYVEASAKFNINVERIFATLTNQAIDIDEPPSAVAILNHDPDEQQAHCASRKSSNKKCCIT